MENDSINLTPDSMLICFFLSINVIMLLATLMIAMFISQLFFIFSIFFLYKAFNFTMMLYHKNKFCVNIKKNQIEFKMPDKLVVLNPGMVKSYYLSANKFIAISDINYDEINNPFFCLSGERLTLVHNTLRSSRPNIDCFRVFDPQFEKKRKASLRQAVECISIN